MELALQEQRKIGLSIGEFSWTGILPLVNHAGEFGNAFFSNGRLDWFFRSGVVDL
jgi:hypothetical protein